MKKWLEFIVDLIGLVILIIIILFLGFCELIEEIIYRYRKHRKERRILVVILNKEQKKAVKALNHGFKVEINKNLVMKKSKFAKGVVMCERTDEYHEGYYDIYYKVGDKTYNIAFVSKGSYEINFDSEFDGVIHTESLMILTKELIKTLES